MGKWTAALAMGALLAMPLVAQQRDGGANGAGNETRESAAVEHVNLAVAHGDLFAVPVTPRPEPFAAPAAKPAMDSTAPGRTVPRYEVAGMYNYLNFNPGDPFDSFGNHGGSGSFTYNASKWLGLTGELGTYVFKNRDISPLGGPNNKANGGLSSYLFGPRLNLRRFDYFVPFGQFLVGGAHADDQVTGDKGQSAFAAAWMWYWQRILRGGSRRSIT